MDTIFAPICPIGGSIVSVRFSGGEVFKILDFFSIPSSIYKNKDLFFTKLIVDGCLFDEVIVKIFREPHSFTGENVIEIDLHASRLILEDFLRYASNIEGFRFAQNGEFSKRAFLNGKMDLTKCEGINAIIRSETRQQQRLASAIFSGELANKYHEIRTKLIKAMSFVEMNIDFSEEEIPEYTINDIKDIIVDLKSMISNSLKDKKVIDKIIDGLSVAIIGSTNVGKSSLLNWIAKRKVAIVSSTAGTTRDVLSVDVDLDGYKVCFYDTAGIRESNDEIEKEGIMLAKEVAINADLCIVMFDEYTILLNEIDDYKKRYKNVIFVLNKIDIQDNYLLNNDIFLQEIICISVLEQKNLEILMQKIKENLFSQIELNCKPLFTNDRHFLLLQSCLADLEKINFYEMPLEIIGEEIRSASNKIGQITGEIYNDDILDNIFKNFCIGK